MSKTRRYFGDAIMGTLFRAVSQKDVARRLFREVVRIDGARGSGSEVNENLAFLAFCRTHRSIANAQLLQDLWVLYETGMQNGGYFVEFGAVDGMTHSNTLILERQFGWSGLLAEPNQDMADSLKANRTADIDLRCVWSSSGKTLQLLVTSDPELSTIHGRASEDMHMAVRLKSSRRIQVESVSLDDLLEHHNVPAVIDYLSVDTEGTELELLTDFDWSRREIRLVSVEHNHRADEGVLDRLMFSKGYERRFVDFSDFDAWYRKE